jgi:hypothetical protein
MQETTQVRPLGLADLLRGIVRFYRSEFRLLVAVSAAAMMPLGLINIVTTCSKRSLAGLLVMGLTNLVSLAATTALCGAMIFAISDRYLNRESFLRGCYRRAIVGSVYWRIMGVQLLRNLVVIACLLIGLVVGLVIASIVVPPVSAAVVNSKWLLGVSASSLLMLLLTSPLWLRLFVAEQAVVFERLGVTSALSRSWNLIEGNVLKIGVVLLPELVLSCMYGAYVGTHMGHHLPWSVLAIRHVITILVGTLLLCPITMVAQTLWYFDLRARKGGLYISTLKREMGPESVDAQ